MVLGCSAYVRFRFQHTWKQTFRDRPALAIPLCAHCRHSSRLDGFPEADMRRRPVDHVVALLAAVGRDEYLRWLADVNRKSDRRVLDVSHEVPTPSVPRSNGCSGRSATRNGGSPGGRPLPAIAGFAAPAIAGKPPLVRPGCALHESVNPTRRRCSALVWQELARRTVR